MIPRYYRRLHPGDRCRSCKTTPRGLYFPGEGAAACPFAASLLGQQTDGLGRAQVWLPRRRTVIIRAAGSRCENRTTDLLTAAFKNSVQSVGELNEWVRRHRG
jgi:hypothetical protein